MMRKKGWGAGFAVLASVALFAACGGDADPAADDGAPAPVTTGADGTGGGVEQDAARERDPVTGPRTPPEVPLPTDRDDPGVDDALVGAGDEGEVGEGDGTAEPEEGGVVPMRRVLAGTRIIVTSDEEISTGEYMPGDAVVATVAEDVLGPDGVVGIPRGVKLLGRVMAAVGSGGPGEAPILEIDFETLSGPRYERPVEGAVVEMELVLDPEGRDGRRGAGASALIPGKVMAGGVIVVELRAPLVVPPFVALADSLQADSVPSADTVPRGC